MQHRNRTRAHTAARGAQERRGRAHRASRRAHRASRRAHRASRRAHRASRRAVTAVVALAAVAAAAILTGPRGGDAARAAEGMYLLHEIDRLPWVKLKRQGLALDKAGLGSLAPAVVQLARGGTGSFVSNRGLIVTNHHVAYRCLVQLDGSSHPGLMDKGHVASSRSQEIPCPSYDLLAVQKIEDVTREVRSVIKPGMKPARRDTALRVKRRRLERRCEKTAGRICEVRALNGGGGYTLSIYQRIRDVRLVYAPPKALGKFGGDVDNWRYPRHTADFTFLRAYVSPQGKGRPHHAKNVPYRPKRWLKVATSGVKRGQLTLVLGFPGRTMRHATLARARFHARHQMAPKAKLFRALLGVLPTEGLTGRRYGGLNAGLNNAAKYYEDSRKQFKRFDFFQRKRKEQQGWLERAGKRRPALERLLARVDRIYADARKVSRKSTVLSYLQSRIVRSLSTAVDIVRWSRLKRVPDLRREGERYRDKNLYRVRQQSKLLEKMTTPAGEKAMLKGLLRHAAALPPSQQPRFLRWLRRYGHRNLARMRRRARRQGTTLAEAFAEATGGAKLTLIAKTAAPPPRPAARRVTPRRRPAPRLRPRARPRPQTRPRRPNALLAAVDLIYARTRLYPRDVTDEKAVARARRRRARLLKASARRVRRSRDPLLQLAVRVADEARKLREGPLFKLRKVLAPILRPRLVTEFIRPRYWDANFTLRLSYGTVRDYHESATGKDWRYVSRLTWLIRKGRGKFPFRVPPELRKVYRQKDFGRWVDPVIQDVPVNFTATLDTTGGNSGSPVLNGRGELVGLLFDGTPESILSDWQYLPRKQRSICVDIRFALFLADKVHHATHVLRELGLKR
jgi:hypothetical protein